MLGSFSERRIFLFGSFSLSYHTHSAMGERRFQGISEGRVPPCGDKRKRGDSELETVRRLAKMGRGKSFARVLGQILVGQLKLPGGHPLQFRLLG